MINIDIEKVSMDHEAVHEESGHKAKDIFCQNWAKAKIALQAAGAIVKNPICKFIISLVITLGDAIEKRICQE